MIPSVIVETNRQWHQFAANDPQLASVPLDSQHEAFGSVWVNGATLADIISHAPSPAKDAAASNAHARANASTDAAAVDNQVQAESANPSTAAADETPKKAPRKKAPRRRSRKVAETATNRQVAETTNLV